MDLSQPANGTPIASLRSEDDIQSNIPQQQQQPMSSPPQRAQPQSLRPPPPQQPQPQPQQSQQPQYDTQQQEAYEPSPSFMDIIRISWKEMFVMFLLFYFASSYDTYKIFKKIVKMFVSNEDYYEFGARLIMSITFVLLYMVIEIKFM